jgi:hypothetical protein
MAHSAQVSVSSVLKFTAQEQKRKKKKVSDNSEKNIGFYIHLKYLANET